MFWGLIMEPNKRYTQTVENSFHVSMASLDVASADDGVVQVMLYYVDRNYLLCTLKKGSMWQVPLDLNFQEGTKITFTCNGRGHVHLTGYLIPDEDLDLDKLEEEQDEIVTEERTDTSAEKRAKRKALESPKNGKEAKRVKQEIEFSEDDDDGDDDDEEDEDDDEDDEDENENDDDDNDLEIDGINEDDSDGSEDEDDVVQGEDDSDKDEDDDEEDADEDEDKEREEKNRAKSRLHEKKGKQHRQQQQQQQQEHQQKKKLDRQKLVNGKEVKREQQTKQQKKEKTAQQPQHQQNTQNEAKKRLVEGGVQVEELKNGNGAPVKSGKFVSVYYVGRLKNGKKFDATTQGDGFKFRLGKGEVIKGWDVGIAGMKVGGKRRITIPPNMAYGAKGSLPAIPPNSTLTFDVELRSIH